MKRLAFFLLTFCSLANGQIITTYAGNGTVLSSGDGGAAPSAGTNTAGVAVDASGNLFIADGYNNRVRKVSTSGIITTVAGNGTQGFSGDGGAATAASLGFPVAVAVDAAGNLFIADLYNNRVRKVSTNGVITTVAGNGTKNVQSGLGSYSGDNGPATAAGLNYPYGVAVDASGNLFIADLYNNRVRKVSTSGVITTIAGNGQAGFAGDGGPAASAQLDEPFGIAVDAAGNLFITDYGNDRVRRISASGTITTVAGNATPGYTNDGGLATAAQLNYPKGIAIDSSGNLFIADFSNSVVRKISASGTITTVAGNGSFGYTGDGGPATSAELDFPPGVAVDASGNLFIADTRSVIRKVSVSGATTLPTPSIMSGGIVPVSSTVTTIQSGEWVSIYGTNLAGGIATWSGNFPTSLGGTNVTVDGKAAYLWYVSPTQINLQAPDDTATGSVSVVVTNANGTASSTVTLAQFAPSFSLVDGKHVAGVILTASGYNALGPTNPAKAGETIELFAYGLGPTNPSVPAGQAFTGAAPTTNPVTVLINNVSVTPTFAGLSGAGVYQINLTLPAGLGTGDVSLAASVGGSQTQPGVVISLQ
jgi:uncharacterized protein (TIGR03437 family)